MKPLNMTCAVMSTYVTYVVCLVGGILEATGSFVGPFVVCGVLIAMGGVVCLPVRWVAKWESKRNDKIYEDRNVSHIEITRTV